MFFPHSRGWSQNGTGVAWKFEVFPAHAGVILDSRVVFPPLQGFSRTRGCDPSLWIAGYGLNEFFPHTRGWSYDTYAKIQKMAGFSRTRGGAPTLKHFLKLAKMFFPHTREWS